MNSDENFRQQDIRIKCLNSSDTWIPFPDTAMDLSVVARFEEIAAVYPARIAIKMSDDQITYDELNRAANRVAHEILGRCGPAPEPIAIIMRLQIQALIAILGVLKAGKLYTAPDLQHPLDRIRLMLQNAQPPLLLTNDAQLNLAQALASDGGVVVNLDTPLASAADTNPGLALSPDSLFFITYTSGTTGQPKGVYCDHRAVMQRVQRYVNFSRIDDHARLGTTRYPGFTPRDLMTPLLIGGTLFLHDFQDADVVRWIDWLRQERITTFGASVSLVRQLLQTLQAPDLLPHLREIVAGGEALQRSDLALFQSKCGPQCCLRSSYGMTESLGGCVTFLMDQAMTIDGDRIPAGYRKDGFDVLILDDAGNPLLANAPGEIVVRSRYLCLGYWRQPELTASRFRPDPAGGNQRMYITGDRGYLTADGCLMHLGRKDEQLKIRNYLVEPVEVESALLALGHYRQAVVGARPNAHGEAMLVAWLVGGPDMPPASVVRRKLALTLPEYMIPAAFVMLDRMPLTPAGKVDRKALAPPTIERPEMTTDYRAPTNALELWLAACWEDVLGIQPVGVDDEFVDLGGDSLQAMRIISRVRAEIGEAIYVNAVFSAPTVASLANYLKRHYAPDVQRAFDVALAPTVAATVTAGVGSANRSMETIGRLRQIYRSNGRQLQAGSAADEKNPAAIFVLAPGRSGTTLLRVMLGGHPRLFAPPELWLLDYETLRHWQAAQTDGRSYRREGVLQALMHIRGCGLEQADQELDRYVRADLSTQAFYRVLQDAVAPRCLVDKTPSYIRSIDTLRAAEVEFHDARYIHLVRHPQAVIRSFVAAHFGQRDGLQDNLGITERELAEWNWLIAQQNILEFQREVPAQRWHRIRFEALVNQPRATAEILCEFLGLEFHDAMLKPYDDPKRRMTDGIHALTSMAGDPNFHAHDAINPAVADHWRSASDTTSLDAETLRVAEQLGYHQEGLTRGTPMDEDAALDDLVTQLESISDQEARLILNASSGSVS